MKEIITIQGRFQGSGRGFGFLIPEGALSKEEDLFIPPGRTGGAWDGDTVEATLQPADPFQPGRETAHIIRVLKRGNPVITGTLRKVEGRLWLFPDNERLPGPIKVPGKVAARAGEKVALAVTSYGGETTPPFGTLKASFGLAGSREAGVEAILYQQGIFRDFPQEVMDQAEAVPQTVPAGALKGRLDLRDRTIITIDGAASKDLDDAISLEREGDNWVLGVHIADVSAYVTPGSPLDKEAFDRGTSVYFADQVVPMLPVALSNGICSLNPGVDRLTLSCFMTLDKNGDVVDHSIAKSVIRSTERMTYADCNVLLSGEAGELYDHLSQRYSHILPMLKDMANLARKLQKKLRARGSLDLDTQESYILCDAVGQPVRILARAQGESEKLIESFMLCANETVAKHLFDAEFPAVYRVHEKPSADKTENLRAMLSPLGYSFREPDGHSLQKVLDAAKGRPEAPAVSMMVLRSMMKARYDAQNLGHFGIAAPYYCHFTSPIRRYPDLMVHRSLHALLGGKGTKKLGQACEEAAAQSSRRELAAQTAERDIDKLYFADYMQHHIGEEFAGAVSGVTRFGLFVALENGVEGLIPVETLPDDRYSYDEVHLTLTGERTGTQFTFGMPLTVVCVAADPGTGRIDFRLPGSEEAPVPARKVEKKVPPKAKALPKKPHRRSPAPKRGRKGKRR